MDAGKQGSAPWMGRRLATALHHRWLDTSDTHRILPPASADRLQLAVADSESRHSGQIRICVESSLPSSYIWRHVYRRVPMAALTRQRALMMFAKLGVWDTQQNNGVLIYLLLAERRIELVSDRGLPGDDALWQSVIEASASLLTRQEFEAGLLRAIALASDVLEAHFPLHSDQPASGNELPDTPVLR